MLSRLVSYTTTYRPIVLMNYCILCKFQFFTASSCIAVYNVCIYIYILNGRAVLLSGRVGFPAITVFIRLVIINILLFLLYTRGRYEIGATVASQRRYTYYIPFHVTAHRNCGAIITLYTVYNNNNNILQ